MSLFVDTWAWLGSLDARDPDHSLAKGALRSAIAAADELVTTDYVIGETITLLYRRVGNPLAADRLKTMQDILKHSHIVVKRVSESQFGEAIRLRLLYDDKPFISFTDFTSMVVMEQMRVHEIMTRDNDFLAVNRGFRLVP